MNLIKTNLIKTIVVMAVFASAHVAALASLTNPENGKEYQTLAKPQPTEAQGKVEVTEFFFYTCPHCNVLDPYISAWVKKQGSTISFKRVPVDFGQGQAALTRMYYTLEALGKLETLHAKVFEEIHTRHQPLNTEQQILNFVTKNGVDKKKYEDMSRSFGITARISRAKAMQTDYNIDSVPMIFVDGRYMTSPALVMGGTPKMTEAQSGQGLIQVLDILVRKAEKDHKDAPAPKAEKDSKAEPAPEAEKEPKLKK